MTKESLKEFAEKNKHLLNDIAFTNTIIDQAYQAGQEAKQEISFIAGFDEGRKAENSRILSEIEKVTPKHNTREYRDTDKMRDDILDLINTKE